MTSYVVERIIYEISFSGWNFLVVRFPNYLERQFEQKNGMYIIVKNNMKNAWLLILLLLFYPTIFRRSLE